MPGEGVESSLEVVQVEGGLFVVADACWFIDSFAYGDTVELSTMGDGAWVFVGLVSPGGYDTRIWTLPKSLANADDSDLVALFDEVRSGGGYAERGLGGLLFTALPAGSTFDPATVLH